MAVLSYLAQEADPDNFRSYPINKHGKLRFHFFNVPAANVLAIGDINSTFELGYLPPDRIRVLPWLSRYSMSAMGASRTLYLGLRAYSSRPPDNADNVEDEAAFLSAIDVSSAVVNATVSATVQKLDFYSRSGIGLFARVKGGTVPVSTTLSGCIAYLYE